MPTLCGFAASNYHNKVKLALLEKGVAFEEELVWVGDVDGEDCLEIRQIDGDAKPRRVGAGRLGRVLTLEPGPKGAN